MSMPLNLSPRTELDFTDSCNCCIPSKKNNPTNEIDEKASDISTPILAKDADVPKKKRRSFKKEKSNEDLQKSSTFKLDFKIEKK